MVLESDPIVVVETYDVPAAALWRAITDKDEMRKWFFEAMKDFRPEVGFDTEFVVELEGRSYPHQWKVTEVEPERRIVYNWRYGGFSGDSAVIWELTETAAGTTLKLTHKGHETFPRDDPAFSRESGVAGWTYFIKESLKAFLDPRER